MEAKLTFKYDREADILHIDKCAPYGEQESEELPDEIVARLNPNTGEVENLARPSQTNGVGFTLSPWYSRRFQR